MTQKLFDEPLTGAQRSKRFRLAHPEKMKALRKARTLRDKARVKAMRALLNQ